MADEATQDATQAVDTAQAATDTTTSTDTAAGRTPEDLEAEIKKLRQEAANYRTKAKEGESAKAELDKLRQAEMTEAEKREARIKELEAANESASAKARFALARAKAAELGFADSSYVKLLDTIPDDEKELEEALSGLLKAHPNLARKEGSGIPDTGKGGKPATSADKSAEKQRTEEILKSNSFLGRLAQTQR